MGRGSEIVDLDLEFLAETDSAMKFRDADGIEAWLPKSQIVMMLREARMPKLHQVVAVSLPQWLAEEKELA